MSELWDQVAPILQELRVPALVGVILYYIVWRRQKGFEKKVAEELATHESKLAVSAHVKKVSYDRMVPLVKECHRLIEEAVQAVEAYCTPAALPMYVDTGRPPGGDEAAFRAITACENFVDRNEPDFYEETSEMVSAFLMRLHEYRNEYRLALRWVSMLVEGAALQDAQEEAIFERLKLFYGRLDGYLESGKEELVRHFRQVLTGRGGEEESKGKELAQAP